MSKSLQSQEYRSHGAPHGAPPWGPFPGKKNSRLCHGNFFPPSRSWGPHGAPDLWFLCFIYIEICIFSRFFLNLATIYISFMVKIPFIYDFLKNNIFFDFFFWFLKSSGESGGEFWWFYYIFSQKNISDGKPWSRITSLPSPSVEYVKLKFFTFKLFIKSTYFFEI